MSQNQYNFQKLTPVSDIDLKVYENAIDFIFDNSDIKNVAITGAYSAGKSSVIESYKKKNRKKQFLHISLANFRSPDQSQDNQIKESVLEGKIINQLIHQIPASKIPQTNFKVKKRITTTSIIIYTLSLKLVLLSLLHIIMFAQWSKYVNSLAVSWLKDLLVVSSYNSSLFFSGMLCAILISVFMYILVRTQMNRNIFRKLKLQGNEIEIFEESKESYFDKYLNEVLYLFENANADVIVFEDLDRFNASQIFERLREINTLINIQLKKVQKSPLRFVYLLRDDIFVSKDRTKFFDYILPIVPILDSSNSYNQFISHFKKGGIFDLFDESFLQGLSLYIDDMRLLKNLHNEFVVYYNRLNTTELDCNKMLALIAYKNLFPRDFSDLQLNKGLVFTLFNKKHEFIKEEIEKLKEQAKYKKQEIQLANNEHLTSNQELDAAFTDKRGRLQHVNWPERQQLSVQYDSEYARRKEAIESVLNDRLPELEHELLRIESEIVLTQSKQLKDIITRENIDTIFKVTGVNEIGVIFDFGEIKGSDYFDLLKYLIRNGYIDETYADYMTYFYENSLSRGDKIFLRSITDKKAKEYTYQLKSPKMIVNRLGKVDFGQVEVLNFDLLQYLLQTPNNTEFLNKILDQLKETKNFNFLGAYFDAEREISAIVNHLNIQWPEIFYCMIKEGGLSEKQIKLYSQYTLYFSMNDEILAVNVDGYLSDYISNKIDYLEIVSPNINKLINGFTILGVSFVRIEYDRADKGLFKAVYEHSLYEINFNNLAQVLRNIYMIESEKELVHKNYTLIMSNPDSPLEIYVNNNIIAYMKDYLLNCGGIIEDIEECVLLVLNNDEINIEQKHEYISYLQTTITSVNDVKDNTLWASLLENRLIPVSEDNIFIYFGNSKQFDATLISFINCNDTKLDFTNTKSIFGAEAAEKLFDEAIITNDLLNDKYAEIVSTLDYSYTSFDITGISGEKFKILVNENIVRMNLESLQFVRENYPVQSHYYIRKNLKEYVALITADSFNLDETIEILTWEVGDENKLQLLKFTDKPLSILRKKYSSIVNEYILRNNLDQTDLAKLFVTFESWEPSTQEIIYEFAIQNLSQIINHELDRPSNKLVRKMLESDNLVEVEKIDLFLYCLSELDEDTCKEYLNLLGLSEIVKLFGRGKPKLEVNENNERLLVNLRDKGYFYKFQIDGENSAVYQIIKRKPATELD